MIAISGQFVPVARSLCKPRLYVVKLAIARTVMSKPVVAVKDGKLRGAELKSVLGPPYVAFYDVPFAAPPIGELRFKDPQPPTPWNDIKDVSRSLNRRAPQIDELPPNDIIGDEDCLYLNVYTASLNGCKPVMLWIHGGGYTVGTASSEIKKPDYFMTKDVVLVAPNYRLGALGFMNLNHSVMPGNLGLKDLIIALEWVQENIANFGGDPCNVTIFGASAGGSLGHALVISPRAQGLFHKAILQSGLLRCTWAIDRQTERGFRIAKILGKDSTDPVEVTEFLRTVPAKDIITAQKDMLSSEEAGEYELAFALTCDDKAEHPVLPSIEQLLANDVHMPVMVGWNDLEFLMFLPGYKDSLKSINHFLPAYVNHLGRLRKIEGLDNEKLFKAVKDWYLCGGPVTEETLEGFMKFMTDLFFGIPAQFLVEERLQRNAAATYLYLYTYVGNEKTHTDMLVERRMKGASHVDELSYLFYIPLYKTDTPDPPAEGTRDRMMIERMLRLWTNFAKTGNPTPCDDDHFKTTWKPATKDKLCYLKIDEELEMLAPEPHILNSKSILSSRR